MPSSIAEESSIQYLITLKSNFKQELIEANAKVANLQEQIEHVDALLLHQLVPTNGVAPQSTSIESTAELILSAQDITPTERLAPAQELEEVPPAIETPEPTIAPKPTTSKGKRSGPRAMRTPYKKQTRLEAIAKVLQALQGQAITADTLAQELFGSLNAEDHKAETKRLKSLLYQGEQNKLWQKGKEPSTYLIKSETGKSKAKSSQKVSTAKRGSSTPPKAASKPGVNSKGSNRKPGVSTKPQAKAKAPTTPKPSNVRR